MKNDTCKVLTKIKAEKILARKKCSENLFNELCDYCTIDADAAEVLATRNEKAIRFNSLKSLSDLAAFQLAKHKGHLDLGTGIVLSESAAELLAKHKGTLSVSISNKFSDQALANIVKHRNLNLEIYSSSLSESRCSALSQQQGGCLTLVISTISPQALRILINTRADEVRLSSQFIWLSEETSRILNLFQGHRLSLSLDPDKNGVVSPEIVDLLSRVRTAHYAEIWFVNLKEITLNLAQIIAQKHGGRACLHRVLEIDFEIAQALSKLNAELILGEAGSFSQCYASDEAVRVLAGNLPGGSLEFWELSLTDATCEALAKFAGEVCFSGASLCDDWRDRMEDSRGYMKISENGARLLVNRQSITLPKKRLSKAVREIFAEAGCWQGDDWTRR